MYVIGDCRVGLQPLPAHRNPAYHCCAYFYDKKTQNKTKQNLNRYLNVSEALAFVLLILLDTECALRNAASSSPGTVNAK